MTDPHPLSERDIAILDFEGRWIVHSGAKEQAIRDEFGFSPARYYQVLNTLIDSSAALAHEPMLVRRLLRVRDARSEARSTRAERAHSGGPHAHHLPARPVR